MIGSRVGVRVGALVGVAVGVDADEISGTATGIPGVTRDSTSLKYFPANATEWTALMTAAGLATGNPSSCWPLQEASGNPVDTIGGVTLLSTGSPAYQQTETGYMRKSIKTTDGAGLQHLANATTAPNPALVSTLLLGVCSFPVAPAALRSVMATSVNTEADLTTGGTLRMNGSGGIGVTPVSSTTTVVVNRINITASSWALFSAAEKITTAFSVPGAGASVFFGSVSSSAAAVGYLYGVEFSGAPAELSDAQLRTLLQTMGWTILW